AADASVLSDADRDHAQRGLQIHRPDSLALVQDRPEQQEAVILNKEAVQMLLPWPDSDCGVTSDVSAELLTLLVIHDGGNDLWVGSNGCEYFRGGFAIIKLQRPDGAVGQDLRERSDVALQFRPEDQHLIERERYACKQQCDRACRHDHDRLLSL